MKLIVGLGNPGKKYERTRHNLGFLAVDLIAKQFKANAIWREEKKFQALIFRPLVLDVILIKPQTFVNQSGIAVKKIVDFYKLKPEEVLVIRDDIDLEVGKIKGPYNETGSGGHKGIESISKALMSEKFYQLKIGVGRPPEGQKAEIWVLKKMTIGEWLYFSNLLQTYKGGIKNEIENWINS